MTKDMTTQQLDSDQSTQTDIDKLKKDIRMAEKGLQPRQRKFCELMSIGNKSGAACARASGYSKRSAEVKASKLLRLSNIRFTIEKRAALNTYLHGWDISRYRSELKELLTLAKGKIDVGSGNAVLRTMMELDGLLSTGKGGRGGTSVVINITALDRSGIVIEGETIEDKS